MRTCQPTSCVDFLSLFNAKTNYDKSRRMISSRASGASKRCVLLCCVAGTVYSYGNKENDKQHTTRKSHTRCCFHGTLKIANSMLLPSCDSRGLASCEVGRCNTRRHSSCTRQMHRRRECPRRTANLRQQGMRRSSYRVVGPRPAAPAVCIPVQQQSLSSCVVCPEIEKNKNSNQNALHSKKCLAYLATP